MSLHNFMDNNLCNYLRHKLLEIKLIKKSAYC